MNISHFIHSCMDGHLDCFCFGAIASSTAVNSPLWSFGARVFSLSVDIYLGGESWMFSFRRYCQIVFQSICTNLNPHQGYMNSGFSRSSTALGVFCLLHLTSLVSVVITHCGFNLVPLLIDEVKHLCKACGPPFFVKCLLKSYSHFKNQVSCLFLTDL